MGPLLRSQAALKGFVNEENMVTPMEVKQFLISLNQQGSYLYHALGLEQFLNTFAPPLCIYMRRLCEDCAPNYVANNKQNTRQP
jgi:hypothetical protein